MAFEENGGGMNYSMPVAPAYGGNGFSGGFGDNGWWIIILLLCGWGGMGMGGFGGGFGMGYDFPWLLNGQQNVSNNVSDGFRDQMLQTTVSSVGDKVTSGFGDVQTALCGGFAGVNATVNGAQNAIAQQLYTNQIADLERSFAAQTASTQGMSGIQSQLAQCCCDNRLATANLQSVIQTEACADRAAVTQGIQTVLDKLCQLELDGYKRDNDALRAQLTDAKFAASQSAQTAQILAGQAAEIDGVYNRLKNCPVGTYPVCNPLSSPNYGCGCGVA